MLLKPCLAGEGATNLALSQESCGRPSSEGLRLQASWSQCWFQGPFCPEAIPLPSVFSVSSTLLGLLSSYMLGSCWLFALCLSRSARCFTHVQGEVDSTPTYLASIFHLFRAIFVVLSGISIHLTVCIMQVYDIHVHLWDLEHHLSVFQEYRLHLKLCFL